MFANRNNKLCFLASKGDKNALRSLLRKTIWRGSINTEDQNGNTPLACAVIYGCVDTVLLLLDNGANINARGKDGATLLHWAARCGYVGIITLLLEKA